MNPSSHHRRANRDAVAHLEEQLRSYSGQGDETVYSEGAVSKQHRKKKLTIPERLDLLFDAATPRFELGTFAGAGMYSEHGDIVSAGVRTVIGRVSGR